MTDITRADRVKSEAIEWLWRDLIPGGMISIVAGRPGEGKSMFAAYLAAEISNRGELVLFDNMEDPLAQVVKPRVEAAGANLKKIEFLNLTLGRLDRETNLPRGFEALDTIVRKKKPALYLMDPIAAHVASSIYNDQEIRTVLSPLSKLAAETGTAFVFIHHVVKHFNGGYALSAVGGSGGGLGGAARAVFIFGAMKNAPDERFLAPAKFNLAVWPKAVSFEVEDHEFVLGRGQKAQLISAGKLALMETNSVVKAEEILASGNKEDEKDVSPKKALAAGWLTNYLAFGERPAAEVREDALQMGHSWKTVRNAADDIGVVKYRVGFGKNGRWDWELPPGHPALVVKVEDDDV